jgi:thioredoxin 1
LAAGPKLPDRSAREISWSTCLRASRDRAAISGFDRTRRWRVSGRAHETSADLPRTGSQSPLRPAPPTCSRTDRTVASPAAGSDSPLPFADEDSMADTLSSTNDANFDSDVLQASTPVLVDFWATWCGPCKAMVPHLQKIQDDFPDKVKVVKLNIEENQAIPTRYKVLKLPTLLLFKDGQVVDQLVGNPGPRKLREFVEKSV